MSRWVPTCDSAHSFGLYSVTPLETGPCPILIMPNTWLGSDKYTLFKSLIWLDRELNSYSPTRETKALSIRPPRPVAPSKRRKPHSHIHNILPGCLKTLVVMLATDLVLRWMFLKSWRGFRDKRSWGETFHWKSTTWSTTTWTRWVRPQSLNVDCSL